jgi:hypothetical protein
MLERKAAGMHDLDTLTLDFPALRGFRSMVLADPVLQGELRRTADRAAFVALVVIRARERGCDLEAADVERALDAGARAWTLQRLGL